MSTCGGIEVLPVARVFARFQPGGDNLGEVCSRLLEEQKATWADCRRGYEGLARAREREVDCDGFSVLLQHNPGRTASTEAKVGERDVARRPCFLCIDKLPREQRMILYGSSYVILSNPRPVFPAHFTAAHRCHRPQSLAENVGTLLDLVRDFGEGWTILYNGPRCGASAPDHLHFQVVTGGLMPVEKEIPDQGRLVLRREMDRTRVYSGERLGRQVVVLESVSSRSMETAATSFLKALMESLVPLEPPGGQNESWADEPLINIAAFRRSGKMSLVIFPRRTHRPAAFFFSGSERIAVSPAVAEMGGIIVAPEARDFARLTADIVEEIYREVSVDGLTMHRAIGAMAE